MLAAPRVLCGPKLKFSSRFEEIREGKVTYREKERPKGLA